MAAPAEPDAAIGRQLRQLDEFIGLQVGEVLDGVQLHIDPGMGSAFEMRYSNISTGTVASWTAIGPISSHGIIPWRVATTGSESLCQCHWQSEFVAVLWDVHVWPHSAETQLLCFASACLRSDPIGCFEPYSFMQTSALSLDAGDSRHARACY